MYTHFRRVVRNCGFQSQTELTKIEGTKFRAQIVLVDVVGRKQLASEAGRSPSSPPRPPRRPRPPSSPPGLVVVVVVVAKRRRRKSASAETGSMAAPPSGTGQVDKFYFKNSVAKDSKAKALGKSLKTKAAGAAETLKETRTPTVTVPTFVPKYGGMKVVDDYKLGERRLGSGVAAVLKGYEGACPWHRLGQRQAVCARCLAAAAQPAACGLLLLLLLRLLVLVLVLVRPLPPPPPARY
eukprot:SAG22_NODE_2085_length_3032_cov_2.908285_4_plen_239_part_00